MIIGNVYQVTGGAAANRRCTRHSNTDCDDILMGSGAVFDFLRCDRLPQAFAHCRRLGKVCFRQQGDEFLTTVACNETGRFFYVVA